MKQERFNKPRAFRFKCFAGKPYSAFNSLHREVTIGVVTDCVLTFAAAGTVAAQTNVIAGVESAETEHDPDDGLATSVLLDSLMGQTICMPTVISQPSLAQSPVRSLAERRVYQSGAFFRAPHFNPTSSPNKIVPHFSGQVLFYGLDISFISPIRLLNVRLRFNRPFCRSAFPTGRFRLSFLLNRAYSNEALAS